MGWFDNKPSVTTIPAKEPVIRRYPSQAPVPSRYAPLPPQAWPTPEEVEAARDYKRRFGNVNEQSIDAGLLVEEARRRLKDPKFLAEIAKIEDLAHTEIARRNLERGPL